MQNELTLTRLVKLNFGLSRYLERSLVQVSWLRPKPWSKYLLKPNFQNHFTFWLEYVLIL